MKSNLPEYLFHEGTNFTSYEYLGSHIETVEGRRGVIFRVWAPNALTVSVVGDFNNWDVKANPMKKSELGIYETFIGKLQEFDSYKFAVTSESGTVLKADPFAFHAETPDKTASKIYSLEGYKWNDRFFTDSRKQSPDYSEPMNIYEVQLGSWKRKDNGDPYSYTEIADILVPYVKKEGYTHIEIMPVTEYPYDGSWGYQVTGYFAVTSRYGTPHDFMYFIDKCHQSGISVILDWVPAHFPKDEFGLIEFDGAPLYENHGWDRIENKAWGTRRFDYGRTEVQSFLISAAMFFIDKYHIDGIRVDAVASMLYLDYDKKPGEWIPNQYGDNKNLEAISFIKKLNSAVHQRFPYCLMIAEESTAYPYVTKKVEDGGLGFDYKWNMGWMNDVLSYITLDPLFRKYDHGKLTFSMMYAFSEHYILPISHDEVVHGKCSLIGKQFGDYNDKFAGNRALMGYMMSHPGKKLIFMGEEYGQFKEWNYKEGLEFFLKDYPMHKKLSDFYRDINIFYKEHRSFYGNEDNWEGFEWLAPDDKDLNTVAYERKFGNEVIICIISFCGADNNYRLGVDTGEYEVIFNSDSKKYGGEGKVKKRIYKTENICSHNKAQSIEIDMPKFSFVYMIKK